MTPKLLIVTPTLGRSGFFNETLSVVRRLGVNFIHVVVHPPSVIVNELGLRGEVSLCENGSIRSLYAAINQAAGSIDDWTHLTYINDDDMLGFAFQEFYDLYINTDGRSFAYGAVNLINDVSIVIGAIPVESNPSFFEALLCQGISPLNQQGMIIPRALWEKLGGFRTEYKLCADLDFWLRAHRIGWPFKYYPMEVGRFRIREGQLSGDTTRLEAEIAAVVARDAPRNIGGLDKFYARWQFRIKNLPIYASRFLSGRRVRGMKMLAGK